ncbi:aldo/keto reductase [bacterium]|nr:aldo/keto reductase [bacterium]
MSLKSLDMPYRTCGDSGLKLSALGLGFWHGFGEPGIEDEARRIVRTALDLGITHMDLANVYGPPVGRAEEFLGKMLNGEIASERDSLVIATKAGHAMGERPYQAGGSRKHLIAACEASLKRLKLNYIDIFYHHCPDPDTPLDETAEALAHLVWQGKVLYIGLSKYPAEDALRMKEMLNDLGAPCVVHQARLNLLQTEYTKAMNMIFEAGMGSVIFSPLAQGMLTDRYLDGIPADSRMAVEHGFLKPEALTEDRLRSIRQLRKFALSRGMSLSQLALSYVLHHDAVSSLIMGVSKVDQLIDNVSVLQCTDFTMFDEKFYLN